jgi:C1A family cysteine protease
MAETQHKLAMGWIPDFPDFRDYTVEHDDVKAALKKAGVAKPLKAPPASVDLRAWCSPIEDQSNLGACTAHAGVGLVEYFERRAFGRHTDASRLFLYKVTRNLMRTTGDSGAFLRTTMGALTLFGVPPEEYYEYVIADFDQEPPAFCYAFGQSYQAISYYRLDPPGTTPAALLQQIKSQLSAGLPSMFGFTVFKSIEQASSTGKIPFPVKADKVAGGHAIDAVGYNDGIKIKNLAPGAAQTTGALLIRNSWGTGWGDHGYGWLPYEYVLQGLAVDWWCLVKGEWIDTGQFKA